MHNLSTSIRWSRLLDVDQTERIAYGVLTQGQKIKAVCMRDDLKMVNLSTEIDCYANPRSGAALLYDMMRRAYEYMQEQVMPRLQPNQGS